MIASYYRIRINCKAATTGRHIMLYISFNKRNNLASEGLVNLGGAGQKLTSTMMLSTTLCSPQLHICNLIAILSRPTLPLHVHDLGKCQCPAWMKEEGDTSNDLHYQCG